MLETGRSSTPTGPTLTRCLYAGPDDLTDEYVRLVSESRRRRCSHDLYRDPGIRAACRRRDRRCGLALHCQHHRVSSGRPLRHAPVDDGAHALSDGAPGAAPDAPAPAAQQRGCFSRALMAYWPTVQLAPSGLGLLFHVARLRVVGTSSSSSVCGAARASARCSRRWTCSRRTTICCEGRRRSSSAMRHGS